MTNIKFLKKNDLFLGFECEGHAGYAEEGSDIVCAAVSSLVCACRLGLEEVLKLKITHKQDKNSGSCSLRLEENFQSETVQTLLKTTLYSLQEIAHDYPKFVKVKIIGGLK